MLTPDQITQVSDVVAAANSLIVILPPNANFDQAAAAVSMVSAWKSMGKRVVLASPTPPKEFEVSLEGLDQLQTELANRDLQISFPYQAEKVDKVSYHISEDQSQFRLVIKPQTGVEPLSAAEVTFEYVGAEADVLVLVGVSNLESLGKLYLGFEELYQTTTSITLHNFEPAFGNIKLNTAGSSCLSEGAAQLLLGGPLQLPADAATNLLSAIEDQTQSFRSFATTAETFEVVAQLMRSGARRVRKPQKPRSDGFAPKPAPARAVEVGGVATEQKNSTATNNVFVKAMATTTQPLSEQHQDQRQNQNQSYHQNKSKKKNQSNDPQPGDLSYQPSNLK